MIPARLIRLMVTLVGDRQKLNILINSTYSLHLAASVIGTLYQIRQKAAIAENLQAPKIDVCCISEMRT